MRTTGSARRGATLAAGQSVQRLLFPARFAKSLVPAFDTSHQRSDDGALLLKTIDGELHLTARLAAGLSEWGQTGERERDPTGLFRQRGFGLAAARWGETSG